MDIHCCEKSYDYVFCSHVIEHVPDPIDFCKQLQRIARHYCFITAPFNEDSANLSPGHINTFTEELFKKNLKIEYFETRTSFGWQGNNRKVFDLILKGAGS